MDKQHPAKGKDSACITLEERLVSRHPKGTVAAFLDQGGLLPTAESPVLLPLTGNECALLLHLPRGLSLAALNWLGRCTDVRAAIEYAARMPSP
jgi:hypothetical protein